MMPLLWVMLCSALPPLAQLSGLDRCSPEESSSLQNESPSLKSLQCYNDYRSYVHCEWSEHRNTPLQLWFQTKHNRKQCLPYNSSVRDQHRTVQCKYETKTFAIGIKHTVFFLKNKTETFCTSSVPQQPLDVSQHVRARPPVNLSTHDAGDGGRRLSWASPYPSSSSLNRNITYQLSYKMDRQDVWTTEDVANSSMKLERQLLLPGHRYEARVRARASVGHWSHWSPVVKWRTEEDAGEFPSVHCVLDGEKKVMCSWEVSREVAHFITYQLLCGHKPTALSERCCVNLTVTSDLAGTVLKYSCSLPVADPAHLLLELQPTRNAKIFRAPEHIRPNPPQQVKVKKKGNNWMVEWTRPPNTSHTLSLYYQLCYKRTQDQECSIETTDAERTYLNIPQDDLALSEDYQVKVRSFLMPSENSSYKGMPSEWTDPVGWKSDEATWSIATLIYFCISLLVAIVFLTLYCTIPACRRRVVLWVDSVPSPHKSKILSDFKTAGSHTLMQSEDASICKVQHSDSISTCSSDVSLWPSEESEKRHLKQDDGCWKCDNQLSPAEEVNGSDTSAMSFSGPYILCQTSNMNHKSADVKCEGRETETPSSDSPAPSPAAFSLYREGYVCLPSRSVSKSTQDLVSHSGANTNTRWHDNAEQGQHHPDTTQCTDNMCIEAASSHQPPDYISGGFTAWPQGGSIQASGYCHLPQPT